MHLQTWISPRPVINSLGLLLWAILLCLTSPVPTQAQVAEVCANGIDDDGDTLIDCDDPDCTFPLFSGPGYDDNNSFGVALGDVDGDGDLDAFVANGSNKANLVWINQGGLQGGTPGTYADSGQALGDPISSYGRSVALGDVDGDGDLDAFVANGRISNSTAISQANHVWINQGGLQGGTPGTYADSGQALGDSISSRVILGDVDGDGDLDAFVTNWDDQPNRVWINQGGDQGGTPGTYADGGQALSNSTSFGVALGDLDGDGDLDAFVANGVGQPNRVWINQGGVQFGTPGNYADNGQALGSSDSRGVALEDLDGDGDLDAWVANGNEEANEVWINQGGLQGGTPGTYADSGQALGNADSAHVALGDLDGDGDLDAWVANTSNDENRVWINQGGDQGGDLGTYADNSQPLELFGQYSEDVVLGDLDGDGDLDAFVANSSSQSNRVYQNEVNALCDEDPDCTFPLFSGPGYGNSSSYEVALGDLDGDGDLDAFVANAVFQPNRVWINQGGLQGGSPGTYADSGQALGNARSLAVALGDVDGDGDLDAFVANLSSFSTTEPSRVWINDGNGNFTDSGQAIGDSYASDVALGDLDGDGDLDAYIANLSFQPDRVWINQGGLQGGSPGTYADSGQALGGSSSQAVALGDVDGDGDLDAWIANFNGQVWINQGGIQGGTPGTFADSGQDLVNFDSRGVALGDLDGDGDLDALVANYNEPNLVWINQGGLQGGTPGNYIDSGQALGYSRSIDVALGDLDGDGDLDAFVANNEPNRAWVNQGGDQGGTPGTFTESGQAIGNLSSVNVAIDDLDGDGDLDVFVANRTGQANRVYLNEVSPICAETPFIRGDVNSDAVVDIGDAISTLGYLFAGGSLSCDRAADSNDDGAIDVGDAIQTLDYLFSNTGDLPLPFPGCGTDPTEDTLECETFTACP